MVVHLDLKRYSSGKSELVLHPLNESSQTTRGWVPTAKKVVKATALFFFGSVSCYTLWKLGSSFFSAGEADPTHSSSILSLVNASSTALINISDVASTALSALASTLAIRALGHDNQAIKLRHEADVVLKTGHLERKMQAQAVFNHYNVSIITTGPKIQLTANASNFTWYLAITPIQAQDGLFMSIPATNLTTPPYFSRNQVGLSGSISALNAELMVLRFSLPDAQSIDNQSSVALSVIGPGIITSLTGTGNLTQFGSNTAPILSDNCSYNNKIFNLIQYAPFSLNLTGDPACFYDPDGDPITYTATPSVSIPWLQSYLGTFSGTSYVPITVNISVAATDGYKAAHQNASFMIIFSPLPTPAPTLPTLPPTPVPNDPFKNSTETTPPGLNINATGSKIQITANGPSITLEIKLPQANIGQFMLTDPKLDQIISNFNKELGVLTLIGTPDNVNAALEFLRFSLDDDQSYYNQSQVLIALSENGNNWVLGSGNLTQFGSNKAPVLNGTYQNQTKNLGESFSVNLAGSPGRFFDPDGDPITYIVTLADSTAIPSWIQYINNILGGSSNTPLSLTLSVRATDGYKISHDSAPFSLIYRYFPPSIINPISSQTFKVGESFLFTIPSNTFKGASLTYKASQSGFPLPSGLLFNPDTLMFNGLFTSDWMGKISVAAIDLFQNSVNSTFEMKVFDKPPTLVNPIPVHLTFAKKTIVIPIPSNTFTNNSPNPLTYSVPFLADGSPLPNWIAFDSNTNQITAIPPAEMLGKTLQIKLVASDGYKSSSTNVTLSILPNQPPQIGNILTNDVAVSGQNFNYLIPTGSFISPVNNTLVLSIQLASQNNETALPGWINFNNINNIIYGTPADSDVGDIPVTVMADDGLGGKVSQTITVTVKLAAWAQILKWTGIGLAVGSGGGSAWWAYTQFNKVRNLKKGKDLIVENPFSTGLEHKINHEKVAYVTAFRESDDQGYLTQLGACIVKPCSDYLFDQLTLAKLPEGNLPAWLEYDAEEKTIRVVVDAIKETDRPVTVIVSTWEDLILEKFFVDPADFKSEFSALTIPDEVDDLEEPLLTSTSDEAAISETEESKTTPVRESNVSEEELIPTVPTHQVYIRGKSMIGQIGNTAPRGASLLAKFQQEEFDMTESDIEALL